MATTNPKPAKEKVTLSLAEKVKAQLSTATIKAKVTAADLDMLIAHANKLKSLL